MEKFTTLKGIAAPMPEQNIDTDKIIPKQYLKTIKRTGLGEHLFDEMRFTEDKKEITSFILNDPHYRKSVILVAGENFGCGSSREHAPWALLDFGIKCIIAPSFADIFYNNCFKNGILPIQLNKDDVDKAMQAATDKKHFTINLEDQKITYEGNSDGIKFELDDFRKHCLINGLDDISLTLESDSDITAFEEKQKDSQPWLYQKN